MQDSSKYKTPEFIAKLLGCYNLFHMFSLAFIQEH